MNWGCTLRVGQMLIANALMRHLLIDDKEFYYHSKEQFTAYSMYMKMSLNVIM
jgi:hypothetical protein